MTSELVCAGVSVVSMGVWLLGESLDPAMVAATSFVSYFQSVPEAESRCHSVVAIGDPRNLGLDTHTGYLLTWYLILDWATASLAATYASCSSRTSSSRDACQYAKLTALRICMLGGLLCSSAN